MLGKIRQIIKKTKNKIIVKEISKVEEKYKSSNNKLNNKKRFRKPAKKHRQKQVNSKNATLNNINIEDEVATLGDWDISQFQVEEKAGMLRFHDLGLSTELMKGVFENNYQYCTPIQKLILPEALKGKDVSGKAQTGTGKTAAFLITLFTKLINNNRNNINDKEDEQKKGTPKALIMAPTRELVIQIERDARSIGKYCNAHIQSVFGGINYNKQKQQVTQKEIDILIATPGRLIDFLEQNIIDLSQVEILVIDEADRMLDMGFIPDMTKIIKATPNKNKRQTMLFSATLNKGVLGLAQKWTRNPISFEVKSKEITSENIDQIAYLASDEEKFPIIYNIVTKNSTSRVIVFGNRKNEVAQLTDMFKSCGLSCGLLSGDVSQSKRIKTLESLRNGKIRILCATDVAARGIHIEGITHVFNYSLPEDAEDYVHRIGRTGRAGEKGTSIIFATEKNSYLIPKIETFTKHKLNYINPEEELLTLPKDIAEIFKQFHKSSINQHSSRYGSAKKRVDSNKKINKTSNTKKHNKKGKI